MTASFSSVGQDKPRHGPCLTRDAAMGREGADDRLLLLERFAMVPGGHNGDFQAAFKASALIESRAELSAR